MPIAELRFGAALAGWGTRRLQRLDEELARVATVLPGPNLTDVYVRTGAWCVGTGHGLGHKEHEADRWVAATALWLGGDRRAGTLSVLDVDNGSKAGCLNDCAGGGGQVLSSALYARRSSVRPPRQRHGHTPSYTVANRRSRRCPLCRCGAVAVNHSLFLGIRRSRTKRLQQQAYRRRRFPKPLYPFS